MIYIFSHNPLYLNMFAVVSTGLLLTVIGLFLDRREPAEKAEKLAPLAAQLVAALGQNPAGKKDK